MQITLTRRGFSLLELLIAIAILSILVSLIVVNYSETRKIARDELRVTHIEQLSVAFKLYREYYGAWPDCRGGLRIDEGGSYDWHTMAGDPPFINDTDGCFDRATITDFLREVAFAEGLPIDPLGPGDLDYFYYYDGLHVCSSSTVATTPIIFATNLEVTKSNAADECPNVGGNNGGYVRTDLYGGTKNASDPSKPYVIRMFKD